MREEEVKVYPPAAIRNVALVGHGGAGKTTLTEALLHRSGAIGRPGRVEDASTVTDFEPEEHKRSLSISVGPGPVRVGRPQDQPARLPRATPTSRPEAVAALRGGRPGRLRGQRGGGRRGPDRAHVEGGRRPASSPA